MRYYVLIWIAITTPLFIPPILAYAFGFSIGFLVAVSSNQLATAQGFAKNLFEQTITPIAQILILVTLLAIFAECLELKKLENKEVICWFLVPVVGYGAVKNSNKK